MAVGFQTYTPLPRFGADYAALREFLVRLDSPNYHFGRWDWMITHSYLDKSALDTMGLWTDGGAVVAAVVYDCEPGKAFVLVLPGYENLREKALSYAQSALAKDGKFAVLIPDGDAALQTIAAKRGFVATQDKEHEAVADLTSGDFSYTLPDGFHITSMKDTYDLYKYGQVLWKGFNHEANGEGTFVMNEHYKTEFERPNVDMELKIAVVAPNGDFASYCGMWQDEGSPTALVEPVATDPVYRKMGLGRAAVLEGLKRCAALGAKRAVVGSSQQFYYNLGFFPYTSNTYWARRTQT